ncbi:MAG TPA: TatD family hydrolase [Armatimonadota bacterium]|nr:TatD family hydrolase [Armatimonadota bacterium]
MSAQLIDTHAHLNANAYKGDRSAVVQRAADAGVGVIINVGYSLETSRSAIELADRHENLYATAGLHPHDASECSEALIDELRELCSHPKVVAVGETGLDFYRDLSPRDEQADAFRAVIRLAHEVNLPLVVHDREAHEAVFETLEAERLPPAGAVLHCYSAGTAYLKRAMDLGLHIGIDGPVTYSKANELREVAKSVPLERLLIETDCPWLTPKGHGRDQNEPAFLVDVAARIAQERGMSIDELADATSANARRLFTRLAA